MKIQASKWRALGLCAVLGSAVVAGCGGQAQSDSAGAGGTSSSGSPGALRAGGAAKNPGAAAASYTSTRDGFAIWLPSKPTEATQKIDVPGSGVTDVRTISCPTAKAVYLIVPTNVPAGAALKSAEPFLDGVQSGFLSSSKGKLESSKSIKLGEYPGRELVVAAGPSRMRVRTILTGARSFQYMAIAPPGQSLDAPEVTKVLDSFQILSS